MNVFVTKIQVSVSYTFHEQVHVSIKSGSNFRTICLYGFSDFSAYYCKTKYSFQMIS